MTFFTASEPTPEPPRQPRRRQPAWLQAPDDEIGIAIPTPRFLIQSDDTVLALQRVDASTTGCTLQLRWALRRGDRAFEDWQRLVESALGHTPFPRPDSGDVSQRLRFGVVLADGSTARTDTPMPLIGFEPDAAVPGPVLLLHGGGGGGDDDWYSGTSELWLHPLPPAGDLTLVYEWGGAGVAETSIVLDATAIRDAATRALRFWPDDGYANGG